MANTGGSGDSRNSRCADTRGATYLWVDFVDASNEDVTKLEQWLGSLPQATIMAYRSKIRLKEKLAAQGKLPDGSAHGVEPVASFPDLYELHWFFRDRDLRGTVHVRQYHAEPPSHPKFLVRLHRHVKDIDADDVNDSQNQQMSFAQLRYIAGRSTTWDTE